MIHFSQQECNELEFLRSREWLVTNGLGGYASSTVAGMNTRRYHGLLIAATAPPLGRVVLLSQLEDTLVVDGSRYALSTNLYTGSVIHPSGYLHLVGFRLDPHPVFTYGNGEWEISKTICMVPGQNTSVIEYTLGKSSRQKQVFLEVRPLIAFRDYHGTTHENEALNRTVEQGDGIVTIQPYLSLPRLHLAHDPATVQVDGYWYKNFEYELERERGLDYIEDLFSPLVLRADLSRQNHFALIASTETQSISNLVEYKRAATLRASTKHFNFRAEFGRSDLIPTLYEAAEQFIVTRAPFKTTIAGYPWFGDWGRDTMIALPGLLLATDQPQLAKEILLQYVRYIDGGMLPNRFPDAGDKPEYNTVDATLWFFEAIRQYVNYRKDLVWRSQAVEFLRNTLYGPLKEIVRCHINGTRYGIHVDDQGFLWAGKADTQLTWMDAKVGNVAITPRYGRPVEIQALWHNALCTLAEFGSLLGDNLAVEDYRIMAGKLHDNFATVFWNSQRACLFDVVGEGGADASLRPNQIFTVSLHYPLLSGDLAHKVVAAVETGLLTPYGLRTLSSEDPNYKGTYQGGIWNRDSAYHQGTVWPWLAGPFFSAKLAVSESTDKLLDEIDRWLDAFTRHLRDAGVGQISEIFDGDYPHYPRGCIAQAWSVAEILNLAKHVAKHPMRHRRDTESAHTKL
jgi:predicted glycogen debranching enzyme